MAGGKLEACFRRLCRRRPLRADSLSQPEARARRGFSRQGLDLSRKPPESPARREHLLRNDAAGSAPRKNDAGRAWRPANGISRLLTARRTRPYPTDATAACPGEDQIWSQLLFLGRRLL